MLSSTSFIAAVLSATLQLSNAYVYLQPGYNYAPPSLSLPYQYYQQQPPAFPPPPISNHYYTASHSQPFFYYNQVGLQQGPAPQAQSYYIPPNNIYSGYSLRTAFGDGGASQVFFVTGPQAKELLQESIKVFQSAPLNIPGLSQLTLSQPIIDEFAKLTSNQLELESSKTNKTEEKDTNKTSTANNTNISTLYGGLPPFQHFPSFAQLGLLGLQQQKQNFGSTGFFYNIEVVPPKIGNQPTFPIPLFSQKFSEGLSGINSVDKGITGGEFDLTSRSKEDSVADDSTTTTSTPTSSSESSNAEETTEELKIEGNDDEDSVIESTESSSSSSESSSASEDDSSSTDTSTSSDSESSETTTQEN